LPGIGTVSGLTAGNYLDSAGTTAATVDNPVGLSLDALQAMTLGAELVTNGGFDADTDWTKGAGWAIGSGVASANSATAFVGVRQAKTFTSGKSYLVTYTVVSVTSGACRPVFWGGAGVVGTNRTTAGTYSEILVALAASNELGISAAGAGFTGTVDNISVREIPGIHATQATTANKAILRLNSGKYSWQFDGSNDSLSLSAPLFQMSDDHCVIAGVNVSVTALQNIFAESGGGAVVNLKAGSAYWRDDASNTINISPTGTYPLNTAFVATMRKFGTEFLVRRDGAYATTAYTSMGSATLATATIGGASGQYLNGSIYPLIAIKGTVTDADLLTLERFVGQLSGVSL